MDDRHSINRREPCPVCDGLKYIEVLNPQKGQKRIHQCEYCHGKGYLKILKHDYDY